ncbi:MAG: AAA family ATPase [Synergistales bacterium]
MSESIKIFAESLYGFQWEGKIALAAKTASGMATEFAETVEEVQAFAEKHGNRDIYLTTTTFDPHRDGSYSRKTEAARALYAIGIDVDFLHSGAHAETQLPSEKEAKRWIWDFRIRPSAVIRTGHGFQAWYFLKTPMDLRQEGLRKKAERLIRAIQDEFRKAGEAHGWKLDNTASLPQLFRLPGTQNCKVEPVVPVKLVYCEPEVRYGWEQLYKDFVVEQNAEPEGTASSVRQERFEADFDEIYRGCPFIRHWRDDAARLPEPHWYSGMSIAARCRDGNKIVHEASQADRRYSERETQEKIRHALGDTGPMTCAGIAEKCGSEFCEGCPNRGRVKSPISLGMKRRAEMPGNRAWTIGELMALDDSEPEALIEGLLYPGVTLLAGNPKVGKSFFVLPLAIALGRGLPAFGKFPANKKKVIGLMLEDNPRRLKKRLSLYGQLFSENLANVHFFTDWPTLRDGGLERLRETIRQFDAQVVFIDTLQAFRGELKATSSLYSIDYADIRAIKKLADEMGIAVIFLHHTRKTDDNDILNTVSGSQGITGAADTIWVMKRPRNQETGTLYVTGRDIEEREFSCRFKDGIWSFEEPGEKELQISEERRQILDLLNEAGPMRVKDVAETLGREKDTTNWLMWKMKEDGLLVKDRDGRYSLPAVVEPACEEVVAEEQNGFDLDLEAMLESNGLL